MVSSAPPIPVLTVGDDAFERGRAHGEAFARAVAENLETYLRRFEASGLGRAEALAGAGRWWQAIEDGNADYAAEMAGIARGSGLERSAVALLNARYELAFTLFGRDARQSQRALEEADGCTTFVAMPETTADRGLWLGQNWDWLSGIAGRILMLRIRRSKGPSLLCLTEAGIVGGKMGVNDCGIGLVENGLASDHDGRHPYQKPFHVRCREILDAERLEDALRPVVQGKRSCSAHFVVAQAEGEAVGLESSPDHVSYRYPRQGFLTHSNHFLDPGHGESQLEKLSPNTLYRNERLERLLRRHAGHLDLATMREALVDHFGFPGSICRHSDPQQPPEKRTMTAASVLIDLRRRVVHVSNGPPCENPYLAVPLAA